jgi:hypothetical protein
MSDEIKSEPLHAIVRYRLGLEYIERSRLQAAGKYSELAADGPAWPRRQASFQLDDNGGVLTLVQLGRDPNVLRDLEPFQHHRAAWLKAAPSRRLRPRYACSARTAFSDFKETRRDRAASKR